MAGIDVPVGTPPRLQQPAAPIDGATVAMIPGRQGATHGAAPTTARDHEVTDGVYIEEFPGQMVELTTHATATPDTEDRDHGTAAPPQTMRAWLGMGGHTTTMAGSRVATEIEYHRVATAEPQRNSMYLFSQARTAKT